MTIITPYQFDFSDSMKEKWHPAGRYKKKKGEIRENLHFYYLETSVILSNSTLLCFVIFYFSSTFVNGHNRFCKSRRLLTYALHIAN